MERRLFQLLSFLTPYISLGVLASFLARNLITLSTIEIINFSFSILQTLFITPFLILFARNLTQHHEQILRKANGYIPLPLRLIAFTASILLCIFAFSIMFYEYFGNFRSEAGMWSIELNVLVSLISYILFSKALMLQITSTMFKYTVYILISLLLIVFLAHLSIMTIKTIYLPELCLEFIVIIIFANFWWVETPSILLILMILADIISIEELSRNLVLKSPPTSVFATRIILIIVIGGHLCIKIYQMVGGLRRCIGEFYEDEGKDVPLSNVMISQIPLKEFVRKQGSQVGVSEGKKEGVMEESMCDIVDHDCCAICTMKIEEKSLIYDIPCRHVFHNECLERWLRMRNSCPTCRTQAI